MFKTGGGKDEILDFDQAAGDRVHLDTGTSYTATTATGNTTLDLGGGDELKLIGVATFNEADHIVFI